MEIKLLEGDGLNKEFKKVFVGYAGCKVNQFEKNFLEERFLQQGYEIVNDYREADLIVFNTCCVTKKAESDCRQRIRKMAKENINSKIVVTGCYAVKDKESFYKLPNVYLIIESDNKFSLPEIISKKESTVNHPLYFEYKRLIKERSRAFLKIQDGCDSFCSYCIVPYVRGTPKSMPEDLVLKNLENLSDENEVVLTGIHLGKWGVDIGNNIKNLFYKISKKKFKFRLRISSLEPLEIDSELLDILSNMENFCHHFHIPLQSGSNRILNLMNRKYTTKIYKEKIDMIRKYLPMSGIGLDIIVGFPTESEYDFNETIKFIKDLDVDYMHIFPYSDREGTTSFLLTPKIDKKIKEERVMVLKEIDKEKRESFYKRFLEKDIKCLFDRVENGLNRFLTREYLKVYSHTITDKKEFSARLIKLNPPLISN